MCATSGLQRLPTSSSQLLIRPPPEIWARSWRYSDGGARAPKEARPQERSSGARGGSARSPFSGAAARKLQGPAGSCRGRRRRWDQRGVGVRERVLAPRRRTALGALLRALVRRLPRRRRRRAGARTLVQPQRAEEPGLCPELGGDVQTGPRLCLAHCGDLAFPGRQCAPQLEERRSPRTFLRSEGRPAGRRGPVRQSGKPRRRGPGRAMEPGLPEA